MPKVWVELNIREWDEIEDYAYNHDLDFDEVLRMIVQAWQRERIIREVLEVSDER